MSRMPLGWAALAALSLAPASTHAAEAFLGWTDCRPAGETVKSFACDTNAGAHALLASFTAPPGVTELNGIEVTVHIVWQGSPLPWWQLRNQGQQQNQCRDGALGADAAFAANGLTSCRDPFGGGPAVSGVNYLLQGGTVYYGYQSSRLLAIVVPSGTHALEAGAHYYGVRVTISNLRATGPSACAGCGEPALVYLRSLRLAQAGDLPEFYYGPGGPGAGNDPPSHYDETNRTVGWQCPATMSVTCGSLSCSSDPRILCATPAGRATWSGIKSLYR